MDSWQNFFEDKIRTIFTQSRLVIDIGGGLRVLKERNNRYDPSHEWIRPYLSKVDYKVLDPVDTYNPDIVGDIHNLPFEDSTIDAVICLAVLEHVENPIQAMQEIYRVLKPGGYAFIYVPFLYYYHAEEGYYGDYWRFTADSLKWMSRPFSKMELEPVRGAIATWIRLSPIGRYKVFEKLANMLDRVTGKVHSKQVSGYYMFLVK